MEMTSLMCAALLGMACLTSCEKEQMNSIPYDMTPAPLPSQQGAELAALDIERAIELTDTAFTHYFDGSNMRMLRYYNPITGTNEAETGSVWMYTSAIEAVNSVMESLKQMQKLVPDLYEKHYTRYAERLASLYDNLEYYAGTYTLTSYTQTRDWTVYSVNRANDKGGADVTGVLNVYDDQQWLIRELIRSYKVTGEKKYLEKAEYLTAYVLDGWDCTPDADGNERGGITWGPGYVTKHACSNGPMVSPLVWLYEIYRGKSDNITYRKINLDGKRYEVTQNKAEYYLEFAKKVYAWEKRWLKNGDGVYYDLIGASEGEPQYEEVDGVRYRRGLNLTQPSGTAYTYNSGTMLTGTADLYRVTREKEYLDDTNDLSTASFAYFAKKDETREGYYSYPLGGFNTWFNDVLMSGYAEAAQLSTSASAGIATYQANLDYAWANFRRGGLLPVNLLVGWSQTAANNKIESMFSFAYASEYAMLANYQRTQSE